MESTKSSSPLGDSWKQVIQFKNPTKKNKFQEKRTPRKKRKYKKEVKPAQLNYYCN